MRSLTTPKGKGRRRPGPRVWRAGPEELWCGSLLGGDGVRDLDRELLLGGEELLVEAERGLDELARARERARERESLGLGQAERLAGEVGPGGDPAERELLALLDAADDGFGERVGRVRGLGGHGADLLDRR